MKRLWSFNSNSLDYWSEICEFVKIKGKIKTNDRFYWWSKKTDSFFFALKFGYLVKKRKKNQVHLTNLKNIKASQNNLKYKANKKSNK